MLAGVPDVDPELRRIYENAAEDYARRLDDFLDKSPFDRGLVEAMSREAPAGLLLDLGCGPAQVARYLQSLGHAAVGVDFAPAVLSLARRRHDTLQLIAGDIQQLPFASGVAAGAVALYVLQHIERDALPDLCHELARVLQGDGRLVIGTHAGEGTYAVEGSPITNTLYEEGELVGCLASAGFQVVGVQRRGPIDGEFDIDRIYVVAIRSS
jgi:SAM-dependent methyltransferase